MISLPSTSTTTPPSTCSSPPAPPFPAKSILGYKFTDLRQLRSKLNTEARQLDHEEMSTWFVLSGQDEHFTHMRCGAFSGCPGFIRMRFVKGDGFTVEDLGNCHVHDKGAIFEELKLHHILAPYIGSFTRSKPKSIQILPGTYKVRTNCCLKSNPGPCAIAYSIHTPSNTLLLESCHSLPDSTSNKAQFLSIMYALLDCHQNGITRIQILNRSKLVVDFMNGRNKVSAPGLREVAEAARLLDKRIGDGQGQGQGLGGTTYVFVGKSEGTRLQNLCRKMLGLQEIEGK